METTLEPNNELLSFPSELLVDILLLTNKQAIAHFASVNSTHLQLFNRDNGLWQQITCRIFHWGNSDIKKALGEYGSIDWKKEFRVTSYYDEKIRNNYLTSAEHQAQLNCLTKIDDNHFKFFKELAEYDFDVIYFSLQSATRMYPHPVGNFTVAYYEVQFLAGSDESSMTTVGAALEGYIDSLPGIGRNSYGYCNDGRVGLECELAPEDVPKIDPGEFMGFGINFEKSSIFFTKNGHVIKEVSEAYSSTPIQNIKALHATVGLVYNPEIKVNFGTKPFKFDILKYQQQNCNTAPLQLFSHRMRAHVAADSLSDLQKHFGGSAEMKCTMADYNIPKSPSVSPFLYMINYLRAPPDWKGEPVPPAIFQSMRLGNSPISVAVVEHIALRMGIDEENLPWDELVKKTIDQAFEWWFQQLLGIITLCTEHLTETICENFWARGVLALHLFAHDMPAEHYAIQAAAGCLHFFVHTQSSCPKVFNFDEIAQLAVAAYQAIFILRPLASMYASADPAREQLKKQEKEAKSVYGPDIDLEALFDNVEHRFTVPKYPVPLGYKRKFKPLLLLSWEGLGNIPTLVIHGIYGRGISDTHETLKEFLAEVRKIETQHISPELIVEYAESCLEDLENYTDEELLDRIRSICVLFDFKLGPSNIGIRSKLKSFLKQLILHNKNTGKLVRLKNALKNRWVVGAGLALVTSVAAYWIRKKLTQ